MSRMVILLTSMALILCGCVGQIVKISSNPSDAAVYSNRDRIGTTPLITSKDEIMPLWNYFGTFTRAVITVRKAGYEDYMLDVNELTMPGEIHAELFPLAAHDPLSESKEPGSKDGLEKRLSALKQLLENGALSKEEYDDKRKGILGGL